MARRQFHIHFSVGTDPDKKSATFPRDTSTSRPTGKDNRDKGSCTYTVQLYLESAQFSDVRNSPISRVMFHKWFRGSHHAERSPHGRCLLFSVRGQRPKVERPKVFPSQVEQGVCTKSECTKMHQECVHPVAVCTLGAWQPAARKQARIAAQAARGGKRQQACTCSQPATSQQPAYCTHGGCAASQPCMQLHSCSCAPAAGSGLAPGQAAEPPGHPSRSLSGQSLGARRPRNARAPRDPAKTHHGLLLYPRTEPPLLGVLMQRLSLLPLLVRLAATTVGVLYPTTQASAQTLVVDCANIKGCDSKSPCLDAAKKTLSVTPTMTLRSGPRCSRPSPTSRPGPPPPTLRAAPAGTTIARAGGESSATSPAGV
jgi:hypothetical protein